MKKIFHEFVAQRSDNGDFECRGLPSIITEENNTSGHTQASNVKPDNIDPSVKADINQTFFDAYLSNFSVKDELLRQAEQNLRDMQDTLLASMRGF